MVRFGSSDDSGIPGGDQYRPAPPTEQLPYQSGPPSGPPGYPAFDDFATPPPTPWFRRRSVLIAWMGLILAMVAVVIWGVIQLTSRGPSGFTSPGTSSSTTSRTTTSPTTTTSTTTTSNTTTTTSPPQTKAPAPPRQAPPQQQPTQQAPPTTEAPHHHWPHLPSTITIPPIPDVPELPTVITLPPHR